MLGNLGLSFEEGIWGGVLKSATQMTLVDLRYAESGYGDYDLGLLWGNSIGVYGSGFRVP